MSEKPKPVNLKSKLIRVGTDPVYHFLRFPKKKFEHFGFKGNLRRVVCTLNGTQRFNCVLFPKDDHYSIVVSKKLRDSLGIAAGDSVAVEIERDESRYGYPMPEELAEVMRQDDEGKKKFEALSPGNQRLMLKLVDLGKDIDSRITRALTGLELLKENDGKFDYHRQNDGMRAACSFRPDIEFEP